MTIDRESIKEMASYFKALATGFYEELPDGRYKVRNLPVAREPKGLVQRFAYIQQIESLKNIDSGDLDEIAGIVDSLGLREFNYVANGTTAICFESAGQILRIGKHAQHTPPDYFDMDYIRDNCPIIFQPDHIIHLKEKRIRCETMAFMPVLEERQIPLLMGSLLMEVLKGTCFRRNSATKDLALLPGGTPVYVDPDAVNLINEESQPTRRDFDIIRENTERLQLPEPLSWVLPDGRFKQELFFPKPANAIDLVI